MPPNGSILMAERDGLLPLRFSDPVVGILAYQNALALLVWHFSSLFSIKPAA
ncbi:MAG: hypothetical protein ACQUHE_00310 [Bacteroidia bacterium]